MATIIYKVKGMACSHCAMHVKQALESLPDVKAVVTLEPAQAEIEFSGRIYSRPELQAVISEQAGDYLLED